MGVILPPKGKTWFTGGSKRKEGRKEKETYCINVCVGTYISSISVISGVLKLQCVGRMRMIRESKSLMPP
jgi:hypothetical protein